MHHTYLTWFLACVVGIVSVARTLRLLIFDDFPPVKWLREHAMALIGPDSKWSGIVDCPFCLAPYLTAGMIGWAYLSDLGWTWWVVNGWWAASYGAAILVAYDQPE